MASAALPILHEDGDMVSRGFRFGNCVYSVDLNTVPEESLSALASLDVWMLDALRYTPAKQRAIQDGRKAEGWTYNGDIIKGWRDKQGNEIRYLQGPDYLERIVALMIPS